MAGWSLGLHEVGGRTAGQLVDRDLSALVVKVGSTGYSRQQTPPLGQQET